MNNRERRHLGYEVDSYLNHHGCVSLARVLSEYGVGLPPDIIVRMLKENSGFPDKGNGSHSFPNAFQRYKQDHIKP